MHTIAVHTPSRHGQVDLPTDLTLECFRPGPQSGSSTRVGKMVKMMLRLTEPETAQNTSRRKNSGWLRSFRTGPDHRRGGFYRGL